MKVLELGLWTYVKSDSLTQPWNVQNSSLHRKHIFLSIIIEIVLPVGLFWLVNRTFQNYFYYFALRICVDTFRTDFFFKHNFHGMFYSQSLVNFLTFHIFSIIKFFSKIIWLYFCNHCSSIRQNFSILDYIRRAVYSKIINERICSNLLRGIYVGLRIVTIFQW